MRVPRNVLIAEGLTLGAAACGIALSAGDGDWDLPLMALLLALATLSDIAAVEVTEAKLRLSGAFVALVLAMVLLGGAPAACLGVGAVLLSWLISRHEAPDALWSNVVVYATFPLVGGVVFHAATSALGLTDGNPAFYLLVLGTYLFALLLNFLLVAADTAALGRASLGTSLTDAFVPTLAPEVVTGLVTVAAVFLYTKAGLPALILAGVAIIGFQHLLKELLISRQRAIALEERTRQLHAQALTDELTGLGNRRHLVEDLEAGVRDATAEHPLLLAVFDLDGFKQYNDAFGHPQGDLLLRRLGGRLGEAIAGAGSAYRHGGDEFCILASAGADRADGLVASAARALTERGGGFEVRSSSGAVVVPDDADDSAEALRLADQRMYARKESRPASAKRQARDLLLTVLAEQQPDLREHLSDVGRLAVGIARELGMSDSDIDDVARAAELHDVGKIAIPADILTKPGPLTTDEWQYMRRHTLIGERIVAAAPALGPVAKLVRASHERWDGDGYPDRTAGDDIPLGARIVAVCDAYDAIVADRPYRGGRSAAEAIAELERGAGVQFDPAVVAAFAAVLAAEGRADAAAAA
jgi:diguanylate cyclase (GGDEF)-like protein